MVGERLHGTDGIRGKVSEDIGDENPIEKLIFQREFSPALSYIIGLSSGVAISEKSDSPEPLVVIGWDRRDGNSKIVESLQDGLSNSGCRTQLVGEVPTPGLNHCLHLLNADAGMMVTASHNPASDSGVKLFDQNGYKSMPDFEDEISRLAWGFSVNPKTRPVFNGEQMPFFDGMTAYRKNLKKWVDIVSSAV